MIKLVSLKPIAITFWLANHKIELNELIEYDDKLNVDGWLLSDVLSTDRNNLKIENLA